MNISKLRKIFFASIIIILCVIIALYIAKIIVLSIRYNSVEKMEMKSEALDNGDRVCYVEYQNDIYKETTMFTVGNCRAFKLIGYDFALTSIRYNDEFRLANVYGENIIIANNIFWLKNESIRNQYITFVTDEFDYNNLVLHCYELSSFRRNKPIDRQYNWKSLMSDENRIIDIENSSLKEHGYISAYIVVPITVRIYIYMYDVEKYCLCVDGTDEYYNIEEELIDYCNSIIPNYFK